MADVFEVLGELRDLLRLYGYATKAAFVDGLVGGRDSPEFWSVVSGLEFWGGAMAICDVEPFEYSHKGVATAAEDYRRFQRLMIDLADILASKNMARLATRQADDFRVRVGGASLLEEARGALPRGFPVIDRFDNGVATSIRSIDVTASRRKLAALSGRLTGYVDEVADFRGAEFSGVEIMPSMVTGSSLVVLVRPGFATFAQLRVFDQAIAYGADRGVDVQAMRIG